MTFDARTSGSAFARSTSAVILGFGPSNPVWSQGPKAWDAQGHTIQWEWGDGTTSFTGEGFQSHEFPHPGSYTVRASVQDGNDGYVEHMDVVVTIDPRLEVHVHGHDGQLVVEHEGGTPGLLAANWTFADGSSIATDAYHPVSDTGQHGSVTVIDTAGNTDTANF